MTRRLLATTPFLVLALLDYLHDHPVMAVVMLLGAAAAFTLFHESRKIAETRSAEPEDSGSSSEFACEVARVRELRPHGNADRLEVALLDFARTGPAAYEVVVRRGDYQVGDLAAYLSVDALVPLDRPEFTFLKRPDSDRTYHRVRAARLRGVYSQGLLVPAPPGAAFGWRLAQEWGVGYHNPDPEDASDKRDPRVERGASKPKAQPMPVYGVASLKKSPDLFADGEAIVITEKIHGTNFRFGWVPERGLRRLWRRWRFLVGSHRVVKGAEGNPRGSHFYGSDVWLAAAEHMGLAERLRAHPGLVLYAELYGFAGHKAIQSLRYGREPGAPAIALFDARDLRSGRWLSYPELRRLAAEIDLPLAPLLYLGPWRAGLAEQLAEGPSTVPRADHVREGCVVGAEDGTKKAKYVGRGYLLSGDGGSGERPVGSRPAVAAISAA